MRAGSATCGLVVAGLLVGGCASSRNPAPAAEAKSTLTLSSVTPAAGGFLSEDSVVEADLAYSIGGFDARSEYLVMAQVERSQGGTTDGTFPRSSYPIIKSATGRLRFSFPVRHVWHRPEMKRPLVVWFYLNRRTSPRESVVIAMAGPVRYEKTW